MKLLAGLLLVISMTGAEPGMQVRDLKGKVVPVAIGGGVSVVTFLSTSCPVSNAYNDRMIAAFEDYAKRGVEFYFVNANAGESASDVAEHRKASGFAFEVYKDDNAAMKLGAQVTPETFVFDATGKLRYRGAIDDSRNPARVQVNSLRDALEAVLAGKPVLHPVTKAFGCSIKKGRAS